MTESQRARARPISRCLGCVTILLAGCVADGDLSPAIAVRDSAGITILELPAEPWAAGEAWRFADEPEIEIGVESGDSSRELYQVNGARRLSDGTVAISSYSANEIRVFDATGALVRRIGRAGRGPGEFITLGGIERLEGDTLVAVDFGRLGLMAFTSAGEPVWERSLATVSCTWVAEEWPVRFRLPDGTLLLVCELDDVWDRIGSGATRPGDLDRGTAVVLRFGDAETPDTIARLRGREYAVIGNGGPSTTYPAWGRSIVHSLTSDGILTGTQESFEIRRYAADGRLSALIRASVPDLTVTGEDLAELRRAMMARARGDTVEAARFIDQRLSTTPRPHTRPAFGRVLYDDAGRIWISEAYHALEVPERWAVLMPEQRRLAHIAVPPRFEVYEATEDHVLGRWRDELGVEYVRLYRIERPTPREP